MADIYFKRGTTLRTVFNYIDKDGPVTGLTSSDFTVTLVRNGVGDQATTGVVLAEIDATDNPGAYSVEVNGVTGFVATNGSYALRIERDTEPTDMWELVIRVSDDGSGGGGTGSAEFSPTAGDGRITDGTSPLEGVSLLFRNSLGIIVTSTVTDSDGLYGPIFLSESVTVYAQRAGYSQASFAITVAGTTATGPGADISLGAVTAGTGLLASALWAYARRQPRGVTGDLADAGLKDIVNDALTMLAKEHSWYWYESKGSLALVAPYSTGTVALTQGSNIVTLSGGTWPSWAASGSLRLGQEVYEVSARNSDTELVLLTNFVTDSEAAATYVLFQDAYALPTDLYRMGDILYGTSWTWGRDPMSWMEFNRLKADGATGSTSAFGWCVQRDDLWLWPYPTQARKLDFTYYRKPTELTSAEDEADWDPAHVDVLHRAIDYQIAVQFGTTSADGSQPLCLKLYKEAIVNLISNDRRPVRHGPPMGHGLAQSRRGNRGIL
jgi:hypothetical protein